MQPAALRVTRLPGGMVIVSAPLDPDDGEAALTELTPAQRAVVELAVAGHANAAIAERRGTSVRTVAKQLETSYRTLGVRSRAELVAWWMDHVENR